VDNFDAPTEINRHEETLLDVAKCLFQSKQADHGSALLSALLGIHGLRVGERSLASAHLYGRAADVVEGRPALRRYLRNKAIDIYQTSGETGQQYMLSLLAKARDAEETDDFKVVIKYTDEIINSDASPEIICKAYRIQAEAMVWLDRLAGAQDCIDSFKLFAAKRGNNSDLVASCALQAELDYQEGKYLKALMSYREVASTLGEQAPALLYLKINMAILWAKMGANSKAISLREEVWRSELLEGYDLLSGFDAEPFPGVDHLIEVLHQCHFDGDIPEPIAYYHFS
jgi:hypothetical protein